ncbi:MAG: hypothetical protein H6740_26975 [Alphaproteobacteria bacterium]|nr:hypothetical protein [Alphaproteobacteria bacterium]
MVLLDEPVGEAGDLQETVHQAVVDLAPSPAWPQEAAARLTQAFLAEGAPIRAEVGMCGAMAWLHEGLFVYAWLGDVRAHVVEGDRLSWVSTDHSVAEWARVTGEQLPFRPSGYAGVVTRSIGAHAQHPLDVHQRRVAEGAQLLICTHHVHEHDRDPAWVAAAIQRVRDAGEALRESGALTRSGCTALLIS